MDILGGEAGARLDTAEAGGAASIPSADERPIYIRVTEAFRSAKTVKQIDAAALKFKPELEVLRLSEDRYDMGNYNSIREAYKYYRRILQGIPFPVYSQNTSAGRFQKQGSRPRR